MDNADSMKEQMGAIRRETEIITKDQKQCLGLKMLQQIKNEECV